MHLSYINNEVVQNIYTLREAGQTGVIVQMKKYTNMKQCRRRRPSLCHLTFSLTDTQPHIVNMLILLKGKHSSVGFSRQDSDEK